MGIGGAHLTLRPQMVEDKLFSYSGVSSAQGTEHPNKGGQKAGDLYLPATQGQNASGARCQEPGLGGVRILAWEVSGPTWLICTLLTVRLHR